MLPFTLDTTLARMTATEVRKIQEESNLRIKAAFDREYEKLFRATMFDSIPALIVKVSDFMGYVNKPYPRSKARAARRAKLGYKQYYRREPAAPVWFGGVLFVHPDTMADIKKRFGKGE